jgi:hypothetical protein
MLKDWIAGHGYVDVAFQVLAVAMSLFIGLLSVAGALYTFWWLVRLLNRANIDDFTHSSVR